MALNRERLRIPLQLKREDGLQDELKGADAQIIRAKDLQVEFAILNEEEEVVADISEIDEVTIEIKRNDIRTGPALMTKTLGSADLNQALTQEQWDAGTHQHGIFEFTYQETALPIPSNKSAETFWCVISATTNDAPARKLVIRAGTIKCFESGAGLAVPDVVEGDPDYLTADQIAAIYLPRVPSGGTFRFVNGQLQLWDTGTASFRPVALNNGQLVVT
jgi:hypothetical protein